MHHFVTEMRNTFLLQNGALWDICLLHCGIGEMSLLHAATTDTNMMKGMNMKNHRQTSNISRTLAANKIVYHSDVVGASPVGAAPTISPFST